MGRGREGGLRRSQEKVRPLWRFGHWMNIPSDGYLCYKAGCVPVSPGLGPETLTSSPLPWPLPPPPDLSLNSAVLNFLLLGSSLHTWFCPQVLRVMTGRGLRLSAWFHPQETSHTLRIVSCRVHKPCPKPHGAFK